MAIEGGWATMLRVVGPPKHGERGSMGELPLTISK
jgi:hypothetical protein